MFLGRLKTCGGEVNRIELVDAREGPVEVGGRLHQALNALD